MEGKLFGLGLTNIFGLFVFFVLMIVVAKVIFNKHQVKGATEIINAV
jgi:hypothetical protein